jgi:major membrane immunogen (membrane-anchored lipoprotein)
MLKHNLLSACIIASLFLTACHHSDNEDNTSPQVSQKSITVTPSLGQITQGRVI